MKYLILLVSILLVGCAFRPNTPVNYRGEKEKYKPYVQLDGFNMRILSCDRDVNSCTILVFATPWIHNPTKFDLAGKFTCTYTMNGNMGEREAMPLHKILVLPSYKSLREDMSTSMSVPGNEPTDITVGCLYKYKKGETSHKSFKMSFRKTLVVNPIFWRPGKINVKDRR